MQAKNKKPIKYFKAADFFMLRTPLLSSQIYKNIFLETDDIEKSIFEYATNEELFKEAISIASASLGKELDRLNPKDLSDKKKAHLLSSITKYLVRMTTRTTPYGLFSGVNIGSFSDENNMVIKNHEEFSKRARPDMEWVYNIIKKIESDENILMDLSVKTNDLITINGSRLDISYISNYGQTLKNSELNNINASIRLTPQVELLIQKASKLIKYRDLLAFFIEGNPSVSIERIKLFLDQLLKNEYLITEMRPPLVNQNPFDYVLSKIKGIESADEIYKSLLDVDKLIKEYNTQPIGKGKEVYSRLIERMKEVCLCDNFLQVDMSVASEGLLLHQEVASEIEKTAELLLRLSSITPKYDNMKKYIQDFMERYGIEREIKLIELLDNDKGLGAPAGYQNPMSYRSMDILTPDRESKKIEAFFVRKVIEALKNNKKEVIVYDDEIKQQFNEIRTLDDIPESFEINTLITGKTSDENDCNIYIGPNYGSDGAGKSFGRFVDILPNEIYEKLNDCHKTEEQLLGDDYIIADLVELPQSGRVSNVTLNWNPREYQIVIATNNNDDVNRISVQDLYVGLEKRKNGKYAFYVKSKLLNKKIIFKANNMLNVNLCSNIYKFLYEISNVHRKKNVLKTLHDIENNAFYNMNYIPRIKYNRVVLCLETWKLNQDILGVNLKTCKSNEFFSAINKWKKDWDVPEFVYVKEGDNRLLLNLNITLHLKEIHNIMKKRSDNDIIMTETESTLDNQLVSGAEGFYISEIVVPVFKNKELCLEDKGSKNYPVELQNLNLPICEDRYLDTLSLDRIYFPGDEWLYFKLYGNSTRVEEFLAFHLLPLCNDLVIQGDILKFFYIQYADPKNHIRLRFKLNKKKIPIVLNKLNFWFKGLMEQGLLFNATIDNYSREVERYGGPELIEYAEEVFYADSIFSTELLKLKRSGELGNDFDTYIVASIINILEALNLSYESQKELLMFYFDKHSYREFFNMKRKEYLKICNSEDEWLGLRETKNGGNIYKLFQNRKASYNSFANKMEELSINNKLWSKKIDIIMSIVHMHCNRILGSTDKEKITMSIVRHTIQSMEYLKGKAKKN